MYNFFSKKLNKKGFTLAELLVVVAIIAVLAAIAIPTFSSSVNKAEEAAEQANARAAYAEGMTNYLTTNKTEAEPLVIGGKSYTFSYDAETHEGTVTVTKAATDGKDPYKSVYTSKDFGTGIDGEKAE